MGDIRVIFPDGRGRGEVMDVRCCGVCSLYEYVGDDRVVGNGGWGVMIVTSNLSESGG
jgi:hypothetical protein